MILEPFFSEKLYLSTSVFLSVSTRDDTGIEPAGIDASGLEPGINTGTGREPAINGETGVITSVDDDDADCVDCWTAASKARGSNSNSEDLRLSRSMTSAYRSFGVGIVGIEVL